MVDLIPHTLGGHLQTLRADFYTWLPKLWVSLIVFAAFWIVSRFAGVAMRRLTRGHLRISPDVLHLLTSMTQAGILVFGVVTALGTLGINVAALVAGLGLTGFALGFALKDAVSNVLAGILILIYKPFSRGSTIKVGDAEGLVEAIDLRFTRLRGTDRTFLIPNANLMTNNIIIFGEARAELAPSRKL